jgi:translation initiation factor IF-2
MTESENIRVNIVLKEFNIGLGTLSDFLKAKKIDLTLTPITKLTPEVYALIKKEFGKEQLIKEQSKKVAIKVKDITDQAEQSKHDEKEEESHVREVFIKTSVSEPPQPKIIGKIDLDRQGRPVHQAAPQHAPEAPAPVKTEVKSEPVIAPAPAPSPAPAPAPAPVPAPEIEAEPVKKEEPTPAPVVEPEVKPATEAEKPVEVPAIQPEEKVEEVAVKVPQIEEPKILGKIELDKNNNPKPAARSQQKPAKEKTEAKATKEEPVQEQQTPVVIEHIETKVEKLAGPKISGTMDLSQFDRKKSEPLVVNKGKRERIHKGGKEKVDVTKEIGSDRKGVKPAEHTAKPATKPVVHKGDSKQLVKSKDRFKPVRAEVDEDAVQKQIKETYARMTEGKGKTKGAKYRRDKRDIASQKMMDEQELMEQNSSTLQVTEFVTVNDLSIMMDVPVTKVIEACMNLGLMVSINQRLDAEAMVLVAEEFGFTVEFVTADIQGAIHVEEDTQENLMSRPPIVTVMGHVDHGKTSLLDYIRKANVIAGEAGGITQHIGAYNVKLPDGQRITFLDTPGHEAFTAMRARGAKVTDLAIIIIAADDAIMPQTREAINHAQAAGVPMIFAINKIDKPGANAERIREQLANMNLLVEDWGGKYQCQEISAKQGLNVDKLLEKILLESELLDLKANPNKNANGTVIESSLDKGRGYLATVLVHAGTMKVGDYILSGSHYGKIKAMFNERGQKVTEAGPSTPVSILGLNGAPAAGEIFNAMDDEKEAKDIANKREQLIRIQGLKTQKHITLEEIGRRIAIGNFQELNIIVKGDVDGSIEALSDSLIKLSNEEIHVNVIHKAVGAISESDVLLAAASNAIIIGFQVRPSTNSRRLAEKEQIEIRLYSVIYDAINEVKSGIEGMLAPEEKEEITATAEIREIFKISKVGTIAGCMVKEGKLTRSAKVRVIRDGIVIYTGTLGSLKRFKDDVKEVASGYDCGLNVDGFNDIKVGDLVEAYTIVEIKRKL